MKVPHVSRRFRIRGRWWQLIFGRPPANKCVAYCSPTERKLWIRPSANKTKWQRRGGAIHEVIHAAMPDLSEDAVLELEDAINLAIHEMEKAGLL